MNVSMWVKAIKIISAPWTKGEWGRAWDLISPLAGGGPGGSV